MVNLIFTCKEPKNDIINLNINYHHDVMDTTECINILFDDENPSILQKYKNETQKLIVNIIKCEINED